MKLLEKLKNAIFEEEEFDEEFKGEEVPKKKITRNDDDEELKRKFRKRAMEERAKAEADALQEETSDLVKQIDVEKTIPKREVPEEKSQVPEVKKIEIPEEPIQKQFPKREQRRTPIIFDDEDFNEGVKEVPKPKHEEPLEVEKAKTLYGGYRDDKTKEKFKPSPNISPVYGLVEVSPVLNKENNKNPKENHVYVPKKQEEVSLDEVRNKAFGGDPYFEEDEDLGLLYEMEKDDKPAVSKVTLGDAEEYFDDLGLEYNVDYTDKKTMTKPTRSNKNEELSKVIENKQEEEPEILDDLEITKEQIKPRTAEEIKKIKKIENSDLPDKEEEDPEEKNLYDLIDMMYDSE